MRAATFACSRMPIFLRRSTEAQKLFDAIARGADIAIGSRWLRTELQTERQPLYRQAFGRIFNLVLRVILGLRFADTQCGFKAFRRDAAQRIFPLQKIERWGFDPEILFLARRAGLRVEEVPVVWAHSEGTRLHPFRDGMRMFVEVLRIRPAMIWGLQTNPLKEHTFWRGAFDIGVFTLGHPVGQRVLHRQPGRAVRRLANGGQVPAGPDGRRRGAVRVQHQGDPGGVLRAKKRVRPHAQIRRHANAVQLASPASSRNKRKRSFLPYVEMMFGVYMAVCAVRSVMDINSALTAPFLVMFTFGFFYVAVMSFVTQRVHQPRERSRWRTIRRRIDPGREAGEDPWIACAAYIGVSVAGRGGDCEGWDSNPHPFRDQDLNLARLPIPPPSQGRGR